MKPSLLAIGLCTVAATLQAAPTVLISDDFDTAGPLSHSAPKITVESGTWSAITGPDRANSDGSILSIPTRTPQTAVIDLGSRYFAEHPGVYTLSMEVTLPSGGGTGWLGLGFITNPQIAGTFASTISDNGINGEGGSNGGSPWMLLRQNGLASVYGGPGTGNPLALKVADFPSGALHAMKLVLNTAGEKWTLDAFIDSTQLDLNGPEDGSTATFPSNPTDIRYVGFSQVGGDFGTITADNFILATEGGEAPRISYSASTHKPAAAAVAVPLSGSGNYPLDAAHLFEPFWKSHTVHGEAVAFVKETPATPADGTLLFAPKNILRVRSSDGKTIYEQGRDYTLSEDRRRLVLAADSRIPFIERGALYKPKGEKESIAHKAGDPETNLLYKEAWFRNVQAEVDYETDEAWDGYTPEPAGKLLPKTFAKLKSGAGLNICVTGDSISTGANASKHTPPYMPGYVTLLQEALAKSFGGKITATNLAVAGTTAKGGLDKIAQVIAQKPDLVVIAFGMNDVAGGHAEQYGAQVKGMIDAVRQSLPDAEFILVSSILANPEWSWSPAEQFPKYRAALLPLVGPGVALADMTALTTDLFKHKRYLDFAGNGINHPNDFGHRLYAEVILSLLLDGGKAGALR